MRLPKNDGLGFVAYDLIDESVLEFSSHLAMTSALFSPFGIQNVKFAPGLTANTERDSTPEIQTPPEALWDFVKCHCRKNSPAKDLI